MALIGKFKDVLGTDKLIADIALAVGGYNYYGFVSTNGEWQILRENVAETEYRYAVGTSGYLTAWTGKADLTY
jgi:hypothetical protein